MNSGRGKGWRRVIKGVSGGVMIFGAVLALAPMAPAQQLVADLSSHLIAITTGFTGTGVVLFGSTDGPGDVVVVVTGPRITATVHHKSRVAGIWMNHDKVVFNQVPSFYMAASNRPLEQFIRPPVLERHRIGLEHLHMELGKLPNSGEVPDYRAALISAKQRTGLYGTTLGQVTFLGARLFRTNIYFPTTVPTGLYNVEVFLIRDGDVVSAQTTPLLVSKVGFSAEVSEFARSQPFSYGLAAVFGAVAAGWVAGAIFRRV